MFENTASIPTAAMSRKGDYVFNDPKGFGSARKIGNDREHAGCNKSLPNLADDNVNITPRSKNAECLLGSIGSQLWILRPQFTIEREDSGKII